MKPKRTHARKPAAVANSRWLAYATAGAASAFTASLAEASIHYSGTIGKFFGSNHDKSVRFQLDQPGDSIQLRHNLEFCCTNSYGGAAYFGVVGQAGNNVAGFYHSCGGTRIVSVSKLKYGAFISRRPFLAENSGILGEFGIFDCTAGQFSPGDVGFIAFKFNNGGGDQYGWARVKFATRFPIDRDFYLVDYAYADPGEQIRAGQTSTSNMAAKEGSLGGLALGAAGLVAWRRRRSRDAQAAKRA